jgi:hypothetical protein
MLTPQKMTKQGVRDLNHLGPKKAPAAVAAVAENAMVEAKTDATPVAPAPAVVESAALPANPPTA